MRRDFHPNLVLAVLIVSGAVALLTTMAATLITAKHMLNGLPVCLLTPIIPLVVYIIVSVILVIYLIYKMRGGIR